MIYSDPIKPLAQKPKELNIWDVMIHYFARQFERS
jgi:hypothetical protein